MSLHFSPNCKNWTWRNLSCGEVLTNCCCHLLSGEKHTCQCLCGMLRITNLTGLHCLLGHDLLGSAAEFARMRRRIGCRCGLSSLTRTVQPVQSTPGSRQFLECLSVGAAAARQIIGEIVKQQHRIRL